MYTQDELERAVLTERKRCFDIILDETDCYSDCGSFGCGGECDCAKSGALENIEFDGIFPEGFESGGYSTNNEKLLAITAQKRTLTAELAPQEPEKGQLPSNRYERAALLEQVYFERYQVKCDAFPLPEGPGYTIYLHATRFIMAEQEVCDLILGHKKLPQKPLLPTVCNTPVSDNDIVEHLTDKWLDVDPIRSVHVENHGSFFVVYQNGGVVENSCRNAIELQIKTARLNTVHTIVGAKAFNPTFMRAYYAEPEREGTIATAAPSKCECGAHKIGVENGKAGHSSWCPVKAI